MLYVRCLLLAHPILHAEVGNGTPCSLTREDIFRRDEANQSRHHVSSGRSVRRYIKQEN